MLEKVWRNWKPCALLVEIQNMSNGEGAVKTSMAASQKNENRITV